MQKRAPNTPIVCLYFERGDTGRKHSISVKQSRKNTWIGFQLRQDGENFFMQRSHSGSNNLFDIPPSNGIQAP